MKSRAMLSEPLLYPGGPPADSSSQRRRPALPRSDAKGGRESVLTLVSRLPSSGAAISLNLVGLAGLASLESTSWPDELPVVVAVCVPIRTILLLTAVCIQLLMATRLSIHGNWRELESLRLSSANGALLVAVQLTLTYAPSYFGELVIVPAELGVLLAAVLQCGIWAHFVHHIYIYRARVEPFWTPVILFPAVFPLTRPGLSLDPWVYLGGFYFGVIVCLIMWPLCVGRMLIRPDRAADPSIFMLMAPVAFVSIGFFTTDIVNLLPCGPLTLLWVVNVLSVIVTAWAAMLRWRPLLASLRPMTPGWVAVTFPLASNANIALRLWSLSNRTPGALYCAPAVAAWGMLICTMAFVVIPCVNVVWICQIPRWLHTPLALPGSMKMNVPTAGSGAAFENELLSTIKVGMNAFRFVKQMATQSTGSFRRQVAVESSVSRKHVDNGV